MQPPDCRVGCGKLGANVDKLCCAAGPWQVPWCPTPDTPRPVTADMHRKLLAGQYFSLSALHVAQRHERTDS